MGFLALVPPTELLPSVLGFAGFLLYRRCSQRAVPTRPPAKKADSEADPSPKRLAGACEPEPAAELSPKQHLELNAEPGVKTCPQKLADLIAKVELSPSAVSEAEPEPSPEPEAAASVALPVAVEVRSVSAAPSQGVGARLPAVAVVLAYVALTLTVFANSLQTPGPPSTSSLAGAASEALADLPRWAESERQAQVDITGGDRIATIKLNRQYVEMRDEEGSIVFYKSAYWGHLDVGTPRETFRVVFDTGSGHLILPSSYCHSKTCKAHHRYRRSKSTSAVDIDTDGLPVGSDGARDQITVHFGTGSVTGVFIQDAVCLEAASMPRPSQEAAQRQAGDVPPGCSELRLILATDMSEDPFLDFDFDGVLGMGLESLSQRPEFNFVNMMSSTVGELSAPSPQMFSIYLAAHKGEASELTLGGYSPQRLAGPLRWSPVVMPEFGHWMVGIKGVYIDGVPIDFCKDGSCRAVADTGTSLLAVPSDAVPEIYERLRHNAPLHGDCAHSGPLLQFELEGGEVTVSMRPEDYSSLEPIHRPERGPRDWFMRFFNTQGWPTKRYPQDDIRRDLYCKPLLMAMDLPEPVGPKLFLLGEPLLRRYYTVYDAASSRVGWAQARHPPAAAGAKAASPAAAEADDWEEA